MKGIAHFATGLCLATFVPGVVEDAARGGVLIAIGGACAMLPDFLDFRFERFLERRDAEVAPDTQRPDPQALADAIADCIAAVLKDGKERVIQLHPGRRSAIDWVLYSVQLLPRDGDVLVTMDGGSEARAHAGPLAYHYDGALHVEELGGPSLRVVREGGAARIEFLAWHRRRTHSLVLAALLGGLLAVAAGPLAGMVGALGFAAHVLEDQLGYLGSNLFWPFSRGRAQGLRLLHAGDAPANMAVVWVSLALILLNLDRARDLPMLALGPYLLLAVGVPVAILLAFQMRLVWRRHAPAWNEAGRDLLLEVEDGQG